ncbi:MAG TPA: hypothetical protein VGE07_06265 [Herpetosiphonaceae bacterium]
MAGENRVSEMADRLNRTHGWGLAPPERARLCRQALERIARRPPDRPLTDAGLATLLWALHADQPIVLAALDPARPGHDQAWATIHGFILAWLRRRQFQLHNDLLLNEYSPDICAMELVRAHLLAFGYASRLETYVARITERATKQWLRSHAARKRGGGGIRAPLAATEPPGAEPARAWSHCYLSQPVGSDQELSWDEVLPDAAQATAGAAEEALLLGEIERCVREMDRDPCYALLVDVWRELLLEDPNITALARQRGVPPKTLFNVKDRLARRLMPVMERWAAELA